MHSSSQRIVLSTEALFRFSTAHAGTSSAKVAHRFGLNEEIISMYFSGLTFIRGQQESDEKFISKGTE